MAILSVATARSSASSRVRLAGVDQLRGLAIVLMVADHLLELTHGPLLIRETITRASMPLFFLLSASLVRRLSWRHFGILLAGGALPVLVPWIDSPNVLVLYVLGAVVLVAVRQLPVRWRQPVLTALVVFSLTWYANGYGLWPHGVNAYVPTALVGLMAAGALIGPQRLHQAGSRLPAWLGSVGRYPLSVYLWHLLVLQLLFFGRLG